MQNNNAHCNINIVTPDWITIQEAVEIANKSSTNKINKSDIYRCALYRNITLSIYFQSPLKLRKIKKSNEKLKFTSIDEPWIRRFCFLEKDNFLNGGNLIFSTEGTHITPRLRIFDTSLLGNEYVLIQRLLASSLKIPTPITGANEVNYGITVNLKGDIFQVFEKKTWSERIKQQLMLLPKSTSSDFLEKIVSFRFAKLYEKEYFPSYDLPKDACFVIKHAELDKLINILFKKDTCHITPTRISTPLSRLFWLACKNNESIKPLLRQPYKLLTIFEQWALNEGMAGYGGSGYPGTQRRCQRQ